MQQRALANSGQARGRGHAAKPRERGGIPYVSLTESLNARWLQAGSSSRRVGWSRVCGSSRRTAGHQARREYGQTDGMVRLPAQWTLPGKREFIRRMVAGERQFPTNRWAAGSAERSMAKLPAQRSLPGGCPNDETVAHRAESCGALGRDLAQEGLPPNARSRVVLGSARPRLGEEGRAVIESRPAVWCPRPQPGARRRDDDSTHL